MLISYKFAPAEMEFPGLHERIKGSRQETNHTRPCTHQELFSLCSSCLSLSTSLLVRNGLSPKLSRRKCMSAAAGVQVKTFASVDLHPLIGNDAIRPTGLEVPQELSVAVDLGAAQDIFWPVLRMSVCPDVFRRAPCRARRDLPCDPAKIRRIPSLMHGIPVNGHAPKQSFSWNTSHMNSHR